MTKQALEDMVKSCGVKAVDSLYQASVYSVIAYSGLLLLLAILSLAIAGGLIGVPEFHPR